MHVHRTRGPSAQLVGVDRYSVYAGPIEKVWSHINAKRD